MNQQAQALYPGQEKDAPQYLGHLAPRPTPDQLHIERIDGGFLLSSWRDGVNERSVAHNTTRLVALVRAWAAPSEPETITVAARDGHVTGHPGEQGQ